MLGRTAVRRAPRTPAHEAADWRLFFILPGELAFAIADGPVTGILGLHVHAGTVTITGKNRQWLVDQAVAFFRRNARDLTPFSVIVRLSRDLNQTGPPKRGDRETFELTVASGRPVVVFAGASWMQPEVY